MNLTSKEVLKMIRKAKTVAVGCAVTPDDVRYFEVTKAVATRMIL